MPADRFARLAQSVEELPGDIRAELEFHLDEEHRVCVSGLLRFRARLVCQRCLGELRRDIECGLNLALVRKEEQMADLPSSYDGVVVAREPVSLAELLEDDLILAIPTVPQHEPGECAAHADVLNTAGSEEQGARVHPFAELRKLKDRSKDS